ncbi:hypothetical protein Anas_05850 [Armadillidium nasatum]|uniref:Uncharacterized protein n=1 Tax=Armadillidium nasatum TaxID=96803 RepID=A0A5N5SIJ1_9CRUS|nr:hypothetical protein Anas_05850 [Armadillidium nasatum]
MKEEKLLRMRTTMTYVRRAVPKATPIFDKFRNVSSIGQEFAFFVLHFTDIMRKCLSDSNCRGSALKQAVFPIIFARPMWRVFLPAILISVLQGSAIGFRLIHDPMPYQRSISGQEL